MAPVCTKQQHQLFHKKKSLLVDLEEAPRKLHSRRTITTSPVLIPNRSPPSPSSPPPAMDKEETRVVGLGGVRQEWWQKEEKEEEVEEEEEDLKEEEEVEGFRAGWGTDVYSSDEFRMYEFKVRRCMRGRSHDWTDCPFAHPGEKARRRDPRRFHYSGNICPDFRRGICSRGDSCEFAHGVFECWLHPARYRTMPCKDGKNCRRKVCFFAHTPRQLRLLPLHSSSSSSSSYYIPKPININHCRVLWPPPASKTSSTSPTSTLTGLVHLSPPTSPPISPSAGTLATGATLQYSHLSRYNTAAKSATDSGFLVPGGVMGSHKKTVLYSELLGSLEALELSSSPSFSPSTAAPLPFGCFFQESSVDPFKEGAMAANAEQSSISGGPDLDWVNELVM